jgi:hypothetical protein
VKVYLARHGSLHIPANSKATLAAIDNHATQILSAVLTKDTPAFKAESWAQNSHPHFIKTPSPRNPGKEEAMVIIWAKMP